MICHICKKELFSYKALSQHIRFHNISSEKYYSRYLQRNITEGYCLFCNKPTVFKSISSGYQTYCNLKCSNNSKERKNKFQLSYKSNDINLIKQKREETNLRLYGNKIPNRNYEIKEKNRINYLKNQSIKKLEYFKDWNLEILTKNFEEHNYNEIETFKCLLCGKIFKESIFNIYQRMYKCTCSKPKSGSTNENQIKKFLVDIFPNEIFIFNEKIDNIELDIYIPSKNIAIEYNGLYWHSELILKNPSKYHLIKKNVCEKNNIKLIQIFEDEWIEKNEIVKNRLMHILHKLNENKIFARNCIIKEVSNKEKNEFLNQFHIQGKDNSIIKLGAFYNNNLVSIMTFSKGNISKGSRSISGIWELNRFCNDYKYHIPGIASKLLSYFKRNYEWREIFSYADRRWSDGNTYYKLGFNLEKETLPNYWYTKDGIKRIHRFKLRKNENDPVNIPEWILRYKEKYYRIWDCGNLKFTLKNI